MPTIDIGHHNRRHGEGWVMYVGPTSVTLLVDEADEDAYSQAMSDLCGFLDPTNWVSSESGFTTDGLTYYQFEWEPVTAEVTAS